MGAREKNQTDVDVDVRRNRVCASILRHFYAIHQLAFTPWLYAIFRTCAQVRTIPWHSHIEFNANSYNPILIEDFMNQYIWCLYIRTLVRSTPSVHLQSMGSENFETILVSDNCRGIWSSDAHADYSLKELVVIKILYDAF